jgi:hypothetical protein
MQSDLNIISNETNSLLVPFREARQIDISVPRRIHRRFTNQSHQMLSSYSIPLRPNEAAGLANPLFGERSEITASIAEASTRENAWTVLESMAGTVEGPPDWSTELDHYLYGTPKRNERL